MQGERAPGWNPDPQRAPAPPVRTRRIYSNAPDPGAGSGQLPPFRPRYGEASHGNAAEPADVEFQPIADMLLDAEAESEANASAGIDEMRPPPEPGQTETDVEEMWLLDEVVETDTATDHAAAGPWSTPDHLADIEFDITPAAAPDDVGAGDEGPAFQLEQSAAGEVSIAVEGEQAEGPDAGRPLETEPAAEIEADPDEEPWDALGEALQQAVSQANPPLAEDLARSSEPAGHAAAEEPRERAPALSRSAQGEPDGSGLEVARRSDAPSRPERSGDHFTEGLAATLESLAGSLRARGFNALDDAFARGDRLETSLALFLAGYRAGRGE